MNRKCVSIIKYDDIIIYRSDLTINEIKAFEKSELPYIECQPSSSGNIYYDKFIILQEWTKYKVKSLSGNFLVNDFYKIGEYYSEDFGYLLFKNCIGYTKFRNCEFIIESPKISLKEFNDLSELINSYIYNLSYDFNQATFSNVIRDNKKKTDLDYHIYLLLYNSFITKNSCINIFCNYKLIEQNPCRNFITEFTNENIENISNFSEDTVIDLFSGSSELIPTNNLFKTKGKNIKYISRKAISENTDYSFDNQENQFIKYFLSWCLEIIQKFQLNFLNTENFINYDLITNNQVIINKLKIILNQTFLNNVGALSNIPAYSTVLTRRDGYRQLFKLFLGLKSIPNVDNFNNIKELIENKSIDILYENYCYFTIADILSEIYQEKLNSKKYKVYKTCYSKTLAKKTSTNYFEFSRTEFLPKVRVHYNKNYTEESYSNSFDPDISIEIFNKNNDIVAIYIFDAKFRAIIDNNPEDSEAVIEKRYFKFDDINKMHTYRDAIKIAMGAFILYPGTENKIYYENENINRCFLYGVGAFPLRPSSEDDKAILFTSIKNLLVLYNK